jgi:hypothetical protein
MALKRQALMWNAEGLMMTQSTNDGNKAKYNSTFWGTFCLAVIPGNVVGHYILSNAASHPSRGNGTHTNVTTTVTTTSAPDPLHHMVTGQ